MKLTYRRFELALAQRWTISRELAPGGHGGADYVGVVFVELRDQDGVLGLGEASPSERYQETPEDVVRFLGQLDAENLSFSDIAGSMAYVHSLGPNHWAAKGAINVALLDGAAKQASQPVYDYLRLGFTEHKHLTSFSIGIDRPEVVQQKVRAAADYPVLKLKVGGPQDREMLAALRAVAPDKWIRVDANEAWKTKEEALRQLESLAGDGKIQFVEQPMPAATELADLEWLSARSPLPLMADESYHFDIDIAKCASWAKAVNVKLVKTGGISGAFQALQAARKAGLKTMLGCMIESSLLCTAAAHLAELTDYLDLDGNLLIKNDPFCGTTAKNGIISFAQAPQKTGLRVTAKSGLP